SCDILDHADLLIHHWQGGNNNSGTNCIHPCTTFSPPNSFSSLPAMSCHVLKVDKHEANLLSDQVEETEG
ncbi:MAG TPA: hypothetical protein VEV83_00475, partial [Parafilimonas sp.]|nr:hypothetical protein [Parafilimonas sp.]